MIKIRKDDTWDANSTGLDFSVFSGPSLSIPLVVEERVRQILSRAHGVENKMGICIRNENMRDINVFLAAATKVRNTKKKCVFYVSCDDEGIINYFKDKTSFTLKPDKSGESRSFTPILPTNTADLTDWEKFLVDLLCLREMDNIFCTPFNDYAFKMASMARRGAYTPHEEEVYVLNKAELRSI